MPVICIGNPVAGGTGKTPLALTLSDRLLARGEAVHFLTRGYGGREKGPLRVEPARHDAAQVGDEPLLLAARAPTWVAADRPAGARAAAEAGASVIVMDDGFQNPSLHKDLSVLVVDGETGVGNGLLVPAGPLREPLDAAVARAQALVVVGDGGHAAEIAEAAKARGLALFHTRLAPDPATAEAVKAGSWIAFAGIGRPEKFFLTLDALGTRLEERIGFPDHRAYSEADATRLLARASTLSARLVTTEKDKVRLKSAPGGSARARLHDEALALPVRAVIAETDQFDRLVEEALAHARASHTYRPPGS